MNNVILRLSDEEVMEIARQLRVGYGLKCTPRYNTERNFGVHYESVGEHVFALHYLLEYFARVEKLPRALDMEKARRMITFHDFGEIPNGDKPYHTKTKEDEDQEREDAKKVFASLPVEIRSIAQESWEDYEARKSLEAQFVYALDKVEPMFELFNPVTELSFKRLEQTYDQHIGKKLAATENFPVMRRFVEVVSSDMLARRVFWVKEAAE
ncbi:MAG TPA: HD domain-containing protein [Candidatus Paceibacterota bacterium]